LGLPGGATRLTAQAKVRAELALEHIQPGRVRDVLGRLLGVSAVFLLLER
jgi:hypothetical protein